MKSTINDEEWSWCRFVNSN